MAHAKLGSLYRALQQNESALYHFDEALKYNDRLTGSEQLYLEGWMANLRQTPEDMLRAWRLMTRLYPENPAGYYNLGMVNWLYFNEFTEAAQFFKISYAEPEIQQTVAIPLGNCELALGNHEEALSIFETHGLFDGMADVYLTQDRFSDAEEVIERIEDPVDELIEKSQFYIDQGQFARAVPLARSAIDLAEQQGNVTSMLNARMTLIAALEQGAPKEDLELAIEEGLQRAASILSNEFLAPVATPIPFLATLGKISARSTTIDQSERIHRLIRTRAEASGVGLWLSYLRMLEGEARARPGSPPTTPRRR